MASDSNKINKILKEILEHEGFKRWIKKYARSAQSQRRFWNMLRTDLQAMSLEEIMNSFNDDKNRLNKDMAEGEIKPLGKLLHEKFLSRDKADAEKYQEALIKACLEMDAACKFEMLDNSKKEEYKILKRVLTIRETGKPEE